MSDVAICVEGLSKRYRIGAKQERYRTLRDTLAEAFGSPFRWLGGALRGSRHRASEDDAIWALKDVSFGVRQGEVLGVIGRNGAGKSTLLKILSRITEPTTGWAKIHGCVGSLLEVGTGFHAELTGRENIYLNGAILGMKRADIQKKFDEMVAFAEVEKFIDTPVKHYSTGMYLRLAFAVAAHLNPDILLVDEVLAVGDLMFQKKCLTKMGEVAHEGRTVLFVSHNMNAVRRLCTTAVLLQDGQVIDSGAAGDVVEHYHHIAIPASEPVKRVPPGGSGFVSWECVGATRLGAHTARNDSSLEIAVRFLLDRPMPIAFGLVISNDDEVKIVSINSACCNLPVQRLEVGLHELRFSFSSLPVVAGDYLLQLRMAEGHHVILDEWDAEPRLTMVDVHNTPPDGRWRPILHMMENQVQMSLGTSGTPILNEIYLQA